MAKTHTVISGDTLGQISLKFYGIGQRYPLIITGNPYLGERQIKGQTSFDGAPLIFPGDLLLIPKETTVIVNPVAQKKIPDVIQDAEENAVSVVVDDKRFTFFTGYSMASAIGSLDTVVITSPYFNTGEYREAFRPLAYKECPVYFGKDIFFNGVLIAPEPVINVDSKILTLNIYPKCGVMGDCPIPYSAYPVEYNGLNLKQIAEIVAGYFSVKVEFQGDPGAAFEKVDPSFGSTALSFLIGLAKDRGFLVTNNKNGDLLIWKVSEAEEKVFIQEGELPFVSCAPTFSPKSYFSSITGLTPEKEEKEAGSYTWNNPFLKDVFRPTIREFQDIEAEEVKGTTEAAAGRMFGSAGKYALNLASPLYPGGYYQKGDNIRALAPNSAIYRDTRFIVEKADIARTPNDGDSASLSLVLPGAYTGILPEDVPWVP